MIKTSSVFNPIPLILLLTACSGESPSNGSGSGGGGGGGINIPVPSTLSCNAPAVSSSGNILYVLPDANAATCTLPGGATTYNSIAAALAAAVPGDEVRLLPGTFHEYVVFEAGGTDGNPITLTYTPTSICANGGEHTAVIDVQYANQNCIDASYPHLIIDGLEVMNCGFNGIKVDGDANGTCTEYSAIAAQSGTDVVRTIQLDGGGTTDITCTQYPSNGDYGYFSYGYYAGGSDYWGNIRNYNVNGADNVIIRNNKVHHTGDDGLKIGHANHIYMLNNEIYRTGTIANQQGVDMVGVYDSVVCGNYIHDEVNAAWGPVTMEKGIFDKGGSQNILVANNVIHDVQVPHACIEVGGDTEWYNTRYDPHLVNNFSGSDLNTNINSQILDQTPDPNASGYTIGLFYILYDPNYIPELMSESRYAVVRGNLLINCDPALSFRNTYGARAYNNTIIDSGSTQAWVKVWDDGEADAGGTIVVGGVTYNESNHDNDHLRLYNNLFYNNGSPALTRGVIFNRYGTSIRSGFVFENNLLNDNDDNNLPSMGVDISFADPADQVTGNPMLEESDINNLYRPLTGSPIINAGLNLNTTTWLNAENVLDGTFIDSFGVTVPDGSGFPIGAFEYDE